MPNPIDEMDARFKELHPDIYATEWATSYEEFFDLHITLKEYWEKDPVTGKWIDKTELRKAKVALDNLRYLEKGAAIPWRKQSI